MEIKFNPPWVGPPITLPKRRGRLLSTPGWRYELHGPHSMRSFGWSWFIDPTTNSFIYERVEEFKSEEDTTIMLVQLTPRIRRALEAGGDLYPSFHPLKHGIQEGQWLMILWTEDANYIKGKGLTHEEAVLEAYQMISRYSDVVAIQDAIERGEFTNWADLYETEEGKAWIKEQQEGGIDARS